MPDTTVTHTAKKGTAAKLKVGTDLFINLKKIGLPGWSVDKIDTTNLGSTIKESIPGDIPEISDFDVVSFFDGVALPMLTAGVQTMEIQIPSLARKWSFSGYIRVDKPGDIEIGKTMDRTLTITPTTVVTPGTLA